MLGTELGKVPPAQRTTAEQYVEHEKPFVSGESDDAEHAGDMVADHKRYRGYIGNESVSAP